LAGIYWQEYIAKNIMAGIFWQKYFRGNIFSAMAHS
jgi:hypothetical protein